MQKLLLNSAKLSALRREELWSLMLRTAAVQARLVEVPEAERSPQVRELVRFLAGAVLEMEAELRRRDDDTQRAWQLEDLDPDQVVEAA